ncbi:MAG: 30S ribosomal protein S4 [Elusimicrobiota bacterium]
MARSCGAVCKLCRREGIKLFIKGEKCFSKCVFERRAYPPGLSGKARTRKKVTNYRVRLREKQRLKRMVGISEAQMRRYYSLAKQMSGQTGDNMLKIIELRLDNVVKRLGIASSPKFARQLVGHGHLRVNGRRVNLPSYQVRTGDRLELDQSVKENFFVQLSRQGFERRGSVPPHWIEWDAQEKKGQVVRMPEMAEISFPVNSQYIVEFYTRR